MWSKNVLQLIMIKIIHVHKKYKYNIVISSNYVVEIVIDHDV